MYIKVKGRFYAIQVQELACECLISLTHHQHNPQWLRHQLRLLGGLDILANLGWFCTIYHCKY